MPKVVKGVVKGDVIVPEEPSAFPEGAEVMINLPPNLCLLKHAGAWRNLKDLDKLIVEIYKNRTVKEEPVP